MSDLERQARLEEISAHIARLGITEQDVADAVAWERANRGGEDVERDVSALLEANGKVPRK
jgi:hypothetical protein